MLVRIGHRLIFVLFPKLYSCEASALCHMQPPICSTPVLCLTACRHISLASVSHALLARVTVASECESPFPEGYQERL
ncbi:hypothetical protein GQ44DRAFT_409986 [Phaeosphaeriaceae sp. PMI808]|nr:hypothetical protein GQ44DRAFT_409986 [Phaeosphaeriaceae sp. PMI808]